MASTSKTQPPQVFGSAERGWVPAHSGILAPAEEIAGRQLEEHLRGEGQRAARAGRSAADLEERRVSGIEQLRKGGGHNGESDWIPIRADCGGRRTWRVGCGSGSLE